MELHGTLTNGVVVLDESPQVPDGTRVVVKLSAGETSGSPEAKPARKKGEPGCFRKHFGAVGFGGGADNESIDRDLAREYGNGLEQ